MSDVSENKFRWYVLRVTTGYEKRALSTLHDMVAMHKMSDKVGEALIPTEDVIEMRGGKKSRSQRKFFPGYVLLQLEINEELWYIISQVRHVLGFIGGVRGKPTPISDKEADAIINRMQEGGDSPKPKVIFQTGEIVRVTDGPFADFNGVVEDVNYEKSRLVVSVLIFGRSTPVELEFGQVEKNG